MAKMKKGSGKVGIVNRNNSGGRNMKKILLVFVVVIALMVGFCIGRMNRRVEKEQSEITTEKNKNTEQPAVSASAVRATREDVSQNEGKPEKIKVQYVTDLVGRKRVLRLGDIDLSKKGEVFIQSNPTSCYSQISEGHYFYMRSDGKGEYSVFRDKGELQGRFCVDDGCYIDYFTKQGKNFFAILAYEQEDEDGNYDGIKLQLAQVDLQNGKTTKLKELNPERIFYDGLQMYLYSYQDAFYYDAGELIFDSDLIEDHYIYGQLKQIDRSGDEKVINSTELLDVSKPCMFFADGKIYYGREMKKGVDLFSYDMHTRRERKIFSYERKKGTTGTGSSLKYFGKIANLSMDEDFIYCQECIIPRKGGEMVRIFQDAAIAGSGDTPLSVSSNSNYIYYIDKTYKVRRVDKKTMKNIVVSNVKAIDVKCTEKNIYVKKYKEELVPGYWDDTTDASLSDDPNSSAVYCMDLDGTNREKIAE